MKIFKIYLISIVSVVYVSCTEPDVSSKVWEETRLNADSTVRHGIPAYKSSNIDYKQDGKSVLKVRLEEPIIIGVATKPEKWGYFQFPSISRKSDNSIIAKWNMNADAIEAYGNHQFGSAVSTDEGKTWKSSKPEHSGGLLLPNGDRIEISTPVPIKEENIHFPDSVGTGMDTYAKQPYKFYRLHELPQECQGVLMNRLKKGETGWKVERSGLNDPQAARYTFRGLFPIVWWGDMHVLKDGSIMAGIYPGFYVADDGKADPKSGAFFYRSADDGHSWNIQGRVRYIPDLVRDPKGNQRMGFTEPAFEVLSDGTFLCVLRTTDGLGIGPMYASRSTDTGLTWTNPEIITPSGVLPRLLQLKNGITVLVSGRPGVQVRFSMDGQKWTDPFEMLPYQNENDQVSCGYTELLPTGEDRFLVIYSDFRTINENNEIRKAIKVREIKVTKLQEK